MADTKAGELNESSKFRGLAIAGLLVICLLGLGATIYWLAPVQWDDSGQELFGLAMALPVVVSLTTINILLRWFRWHFLLRRMGLLLQTRESFRVFTNTLPLLIVPFYLGELARPFLLEHPSLRSRRIIFSAWVIERVADALAMLFLLLLALGNLWGSLVALAALMVVAQILIGKLQKRSAAEGTANANSTVLAIVFTGSSLIAWALPCLAFAVTLLLVGERWNPAVATEAFALGTFLGALSGIPLGTAVVGSTAILVLGQHGFPEDVATLSVLVLRLGTVWYAVAAGLVLVLLRIRTRRRMVNSGVSEHFDELAADYAGEIPAHQRERLVGRKVKAMESHLGSFAGLEGLDIGCGQGWYAAEVTQRCARMIGVDMSLGQIQQARQFVDGTGLSLPTCVANAAKLPFPDNTFDFVYAINVFHHILDTADRQQAFEEVVRVLKPGGKFFLNEINVENPLFRFYMSYVFPLINRIDEGIEAWLRCGQLPSLPNAEWEQDVDYFTFLPDFISLGLWKVLRPLERRLENSKRLRRFSAHYVAVLIKNLPS